MKRRKGSFFKRRKQNHKDKEKGKKSQEIEIEKQIDAEMMQPYTELNPVVWLLSRILMNNTIEPEGRFHFWLNLFTNVFSGFSILFTSWGWAFQSHTQAVAQVIKWSKRLHQIFHNSKKCYNPHCPLTLLMEDLVMSKLAMVLQTDSKSFPQPFR